MNFIQTLDRCHAQQTCEIISLKGDLDTKLRLLNLGFHTYSHVKILFLQSLNLVIDVDGSRFAIDFNMAKNIQVKTLS